MPTVRKTPDNIIGRKYWERDQAVKVLARTGPRNVLIEREDGSQVVRPFRGLRPVRWYCVDCDLDTLEAGHYYSVHDALWAAAGMAPNGGMLCLDCLERRLGRALALDDFNALLPSAWPLPLFDPADGEHWRRAFAAWRRQRAARKRAASA
jgi:hypothetical protein